MAVRPFRDTDRERWDRFVRGAPHAHAYHLAGWASVIRRSFGQRPLYLVSENGAGAIDGVLPLVRLQSRMFGDFLVSVPYLNYGGPCASERATEVALIEEAVRLARDQQVEHLEVRLTVGDGFGLRVKASKVAMRLALPSDPGTLWKSFPSKLRNQINRPVREGMTAHIGGLDQLDAFHHVFSVNMRDVGTPVYGRRFFENVLSEFPDSARICTISHRGQPVASGLVVGFRETLEIPWASSLRTFNRLAPNMLLYWSLLKHACESGFRVFDFGRSSPDAGTYKFKEQWGARPLPLYWHYWVDGESPLPEINPANPKYRLAVNVWKRLPVGLTRLIGPAIVRNIP